MRPRIFHGLIALLGVLPVITPPLFADEKPDEETTQRITHLIGMLASRNPAPKLIGEESKREIRGKPMGETVQAVFHKSYDSNLQVPVYLAMQQLLTEGEPALDLLLKHQDDRRYCLSIHSIEDDKNETVASICSRIFWAIVLPLEDELHFMTKDQWRVYPAGYDSAVAWWKDKKKLGLAKVQIEAIDAMLDFMQKADARKAVPWHPEAEKIPPAEFEKRRKENIRILKAVRETILSTGKPYRPRTCLPWFEYLIGLPWTTSVTTR
jgi:hypothetical protein